MTRQILLQLGWEVLIHLLYSPDIESSDLHLFQSLQNSLNGKISIPWKTVKGNWNSSLLKKRKGFEKMELKLPEKWQKVVQQNGEYVVQ